MNERSMKHMQQNSVYESINQYTKFLSSHFA